MKRCTTCNRTYTDPNLSYCVEDGTPLTTDPVDDESTVVPRYRPPTYVPEESRKPRRMWPWVLGLVGAFVLGIVALTIAAAIIVPRMMRERQVQRPVTTNANTNETPPTEKPVAETPVTEEVTATPAPTDEEQVLAQLKDIEHDWTVANLNADKQKLERILADDYVGPAAEQGKLQGKKEYINTVQRDTEIDKWEFDDLKVHLSGDRATLTGKITYFSGDRKAEFNFTDKFVWRNGRWQATGSEVQRRD